MRNRIGLLTILFAVLLLDAGCARRAPPVRIEHAKPGEIPPDVIAALVGEKPFDVTFIETTVKLPPVPSQVGCDWSSLPPKLRFVSASDPHSEVVDESKHAMTKLADGGWRPAPEFKAHYLFALDYEKPLRAVMVRGGETFEVPLDSESRASSRKWIAFVCAREDEVAVEEDFPGFGGDLKVLRRVHGHWQVVAEGTTWST